MSCTPRASQKWKNQVLIMCCVQGTACMGKSTGCTCTLWNLEVFCQVRECVAPFDGILRY
jgi:hypothetical protein